MNYFDRKYKDNISNYRSVWYFYPIYYGTFFHPLLYEPTTILTKITIFRSWSSASKKYCWHTVLYTSIMVPFVRAILYCTYALCPRIPAKNRQLHSSNKVVAASHGRRPPPCVCSSIACSAARACTTPTASACERQFLRLIMGAAQGEFIFPKSTA